MIRVPFFLIFGFNKKPQIQTKGKRVLLVNLEALNPKLYNPWNKSQFDLAGCCSVRRRNDHDSFVGLIFRAKKYRAESLG